MKNAFTEEAVLQSGIFKKMLDKYFNNEVEGLNEIKELAEAGKIKKVVIAGMGSSYYASYTVQSYLTKKRIPCIVLNAFDAARYMWEVVDSETLVVGVSQSGKSWELNDFFKNLGGRTKIVGICNKDESLLNTNADIHLPMFAETEVFFANRSFMHSLAILNIMAYTITGDDMSALKKELYDFNDWLANLNANYDEICAPIAQATIGGDMFDVISNGPSIAAGMQAGINFREGPSVRSNWNMLADYAHDWILSVSKGYRVFFFVPKFDEEVAVRMYNRVLEKGGKAIVFTADHDFEFNEFTTVVYHPECSDNIASLYQIALSNFMLAEMLGEGWHR